MNDFHTNDWTDILLDKELAELEASEIEQSANEAGYDLQ